MALRFLNSGYFAGSVGIGTDSPLKKLSVSGGDIAVNNGNGFIVGAATTGNTEIGRLSASSGQLQILTESTRDIKFGSTTYGNIMFLEGTNGNVGIGIESPTKTLNVEFNSSSVVPETGEGLGGGAAGTGVLLRNSNATVGTFANLDFRANNSDGRIAYTHNATNDGDFHFILDNTTAVPLTRLFIEGETGNVGIGTDNPVPALHVYQNNTKGGTAAGLTIEQEGTGDAVLSFLLTGTERWKMGIDNSDSDKFKISKATNLSSNNALTIDANSNIGIGTTGPISVLEISKQLSAASTIDYPYTISSRDDGGLINQLGGEGVGIKFRIAGNDATTPGNSLVGASIAAIKEGSSDTNSSAGLGFFVSQDDETLDEAVRIDHDGNVGINDTTPSYKLDVNGEGRFIGDLRCLSLIQTSQSDKKEFIQDIVKTTNKKIEFKEYVYKSDSGNRKRYGVLAEDIEVDYPELVHIDADGVKGVNYIDLLVKRVAELERELEDVYLTAADDLAAPSASKVGTFRYRTSGNNSYVDMCMQTGATTYAWVNIVQNNW